MFKCDDSVTALAQMFPKQVSPNDDNNSFGLMDLHYRHELSPYKSGRLASAIKLCASVVHVDISLSRGDRFTDRDLKALLHLDQLRHLIISQPLKKALISFAGGLLPVLEHFGPKSLESLQLEYFPDVNVVAIADHCQKLRSLSLVDVDLFGSPVANFNSVHRHQLPCLKELIIMHMEWDPEEASSTSADLSFLLLSSPELITLKFNSLDEVDDQVFERPALHHGFPRLEKLTISWCDNVTERAIDLLLTLKSPLKMMELDSCQLLTEAHCEVWRKQIHDNNWDTSISFTPY